jgi:hypothetical protein
MYFPKPILEALLAQRGACPIETHTYDFFKILFRNKLLGPRSSSPPPCLDIWQKEFFFFFLFPANNIKGRVSTGQGYVGSESAGPPPTPPAFGTVKTGP